jgi:hypothetical protein
MKFLVFLLFMLSPLNILSQMADWKEAQSFPVEQNGQILQMPFAGSFNSAQVESIDLNGDGVEDLVVFDRTCQKLSTFLVQKSPTKISYQYAPIYELKFPFIENWFHLVDYDGDRKKDLFTYTPAGIKVFKNTGFDQTLPFQLAQDPLYSEGFSGVINLYVAPSDIPAIVDLDGDGDVDVVAFEPAGHFLELHQNFSSDVSKKPGFLFKRTVQVWGNFIHNDCRDIVFSSPVNNALRSESIQSVHQIQHVGNALSLWDPQNKGVFDLLYGHISCTNLVQLKNNGSGLEPILENPIFDFPLNQAVQVASFAYASPIDIDFDGVKDLLVSTNTSDHVNYTQDFQRNLIYYQNGVNKIKNDFLQGDMIDVGENASPVFWDADQDGDLDLLIGNAGIRGQRGVRASVYLYENKGSKDEPRYVFVTNDFRKFSEKTQGTDLRLQLVDWNSDGKKDLILNYETFVQPEMQVFLAGNESIFTYDLKGINPGEIPVFRDLDQDGQLDVLVLSKTGQIRRLNFREMSKGMLEWTLVSSDFLGLSKEKNWSFQCFDFIDDLGLGQWKMLGLDKLGFVHFGEFDLVKNTWKELSLPPGLTQNFGINSMLQVLDWNRDGKMDFLVGSGGGGVRLMQNRSRSIILDNQEALFQLWPNPSSGEFYVRANKKGQLFVMDLLGRIVHSNLHLEEKETKKESLSGLAKGMYFVQFLGESGKKEVKRLVLE